MPENDNAQIQDYARRVARGEGFTAWPDAAAGAADETAFRQAMEQRKAELLARRRRVRHPALLTHAEVAQAQRNLKAAAWARDWFARLRDVADYLAAQPPEYVTEMLPALTPWVGYTFFCPHCYGIKSFEGTEYTLIDWDYRRPHQLHCTACGQVYPSPRYPEAAPLVCPRRGQTLTFYRNAAETAHPDDPPEQHAWHWAARPVHPCFSGVIREQQIQFMIHGARALAMVYRFTDEPRYARTAAAILQRLAHCFRHEWLYHDYWDTVADCDPLYAAWHDRDLPLAWKRNLFPRAYAKDTPERAAMLQGYWGAGRVHPSTGCVSLVPYLCLAWDLIQGARDEQGALLCTEADSERIVRDLFLEWLFEAEPFVGGAGKAESVNNKSPRVYHAMATVARCCGLDDYADVAWRGYQAIRDRSFASDGMCRETPSYNDMYLGELLAITERLCGCQLPATAGQPARRLNPYREDPRLRRILRTRLDQCRPDGRLLPLGDSHEALPTDPHGSQILEIGLRRDPAYYRQRLPLVYHWRGATPTEYAVLHLAAGDFIVPRTGLGDLDVLEGGFPDWMVALLRHGLGPRGSVAALSFSVAGGHRHYDNLALYYADRGQTILGDHGYLAEAPAQRWIKHTFSHNLVIVDEQCQLFRSGGERRPELRLLATGWRVSVVEAASVAYSQARDYRRLVALFKGPRDATFLLDVFRVKGGRRHDYRLFSEVAASEAGDRGSLVFQGVTMPPEPPLPQLGASEKEEDIFGLRDVRQATPTAAWQATWREDGGRQYRLWMLTPGLTAQAANGPGQERWGDLSHVGRRVRYVDAIATGEDLATTFVALHEPDGPGGALPILAAERLALPATAGPDALALRLTTTWGELVVLNEFIGLTEVAGIRFQGRFGVLARTPDRRWFLAVGATTLEAAGLGFRDRPAAWEGEARVNGQYELIPATPRPAGWPASGAGATATVLVNVEGRWTGYPVQRAPGNRIVVARFPLPTSIREFRLPALACGARISRH